MLNRYYHVLSVELGVVVESIGLRLHVPNLQIRASFNWVLFRCVRYSRLRTAVVGPSVTDLVLPCTTLLNQSPTKQLIVGRGQLKHLLDVPFGCFELSFVGDSITQP